MGIGQWFEQHAIHDAEDCSVGSDADGQRDQRNRREPWRAREAPQNLSKLTVVRTHSTEPPHEVVTKRRAYPAEQPNYLCVCTLHKFPNPCRPDFGART